MPLVPSTGPEPVRERADVGPHRGVPALVGAERAGGDQPFLTVHDLDRRGQLVGVDPDDHLCHVPRLQGRLEPVTGRRGGQCYYERDSPLLSHASSAVPDEAQSRREPQPHGLGSRDRERPAGHLNRVWPDPIMKRSLLVAAGRASAPWLVFLGTLRRR